MRRYEECVRTRGYPHSSRATAATFLSTLQCAPGEALETKFPESLSFSCKTLARSRPYRQRSLQENIALFRRMFRGVLQDHLPGSSKVCKIMLRNLVKYQANICKLQKQNLRFFLFSAINPILSDMKTFVHASENISRKGSERGVCILVIKKET